MNEPSTNFVLEQLSKGNAQNYIEKEIQTRPDMTFKSFFDNYIGTHDLVLSDVIKVSELDRNYAYQIIDEKKKGSRDKIIAICYAAGMNLDEINHALIYTNNGQLYAKNTRDAHIILKINKTKPNPYRKVMDLNDYLESKNQERLGV